MSDDALELIAVEIVERPLRHCDRRIRRCVAGGKGVDSGLLLENVDLRHRHAGSDGHLLDDVDQSFALDVRGVAADPDPAERPRYDASAPSQLERLVQAREAQAGDDEERPRECAPGIGECVFQGSHRDALAVQVAVCDAKSEEGHQIEGKGHGEQRRYEANHEPARLAARGRLTGVEIHS